VADGFSSESAQADAASEPGGGVSGFDPGVAGTDHHDI
jgi:hypothetical protein